MCMTKKLLLAFTFIFFSGCGTVKTKEAFVEEDLKTFDKKTFTVNNLSFNEAKQIMQNFGDECLNMRSYRTNSSVTNRFKPSIEHLPKESSLYVSFEMRGSFGTGSEQYVFLGKITDLGKSTVQGETYSKSFFLSVDSTDIAKRFAEWMKKERKLCPKLLD